MRNYLKTTIMVGIVVGVILLIIGPIVSSINPLDESFPSDEEKLLKKIDNNIEKQNEIFEQIGIQEQLTAQNKIIVDTVLLEKLELLDQENNRLRQQLEQIDQTVEIAKNNLLMKSNTYFILNNMILH